MRSVLMLLLLASPVLAQETPATPTSTSACGPVNVKFDVKEDKAQQSLRPRDSGKALVYMIEDYAEVECLGPCVTVRIGLDGSWIGANQGNTYFFFTVTPGQHHLCSNWQSKLESLSSMYSMANFTAEAGKTYYFRTRIWSSYQILRLDLDAINSDEGSYLVASFPLAVSHPKK